MYKEVDGVKIYYEQMGKGKNIVLLHGWGQNIQMMLPLAKHLEKNFKVTLIDLPGFAKSADLDKVLSIDNYVELINKLLKTLKIKKPSFIGHSFGGKISLAYASLYEVDKLVLLASPAFASKEKAGLKLKFLKLVKKLPLMHYFENFAKSFIGSSDYKEASPLLRNILVETIRTDLSDRLPLIKAETLLIWGDKDEAVSLEDARKIESLVKNSALIVLDNATHYAYLERLGQVNAILDNFL